MKDVVFVIAAYGVIIGGLGLYALALLGRLAAARRQVPPEVQRENPIDQGDGGRA
jgi:hypothetical protein